MKLHLAAPGGQNLFTGYGRGYVAINGVRREKHAIVTAHEITDWNIAGFDALVSGDFELLLSLRPEVVILGTGATLRFPAPALTSTLAASGIGLDAMDTGAACRTYNILMGEGRKVAAAIIVG